MKLHVLAGSIGAAIVIAGYIIQIWTLIRFRRAEGVSAASYLLWGAASALLLVHAIRIGSPVFMILTGFQVTGCLLIAGMAVAFTRRGFPAEAPKPGAFPQTDFGRNDE